jgi:hypothetical protein
MYIFSVVRYCSIMMSGVFLYRSVREEVWVLLDFIVSFLDVGTSWRRVVSFTPGKSPRYPLDRRLGGPQIRSGRYGEVKIFYPSGTRTPTPRLSNPKSVAIPTALSIPVGIMQRN